MKHYLGVFSRGEESGFECRVKLVVQHALKPTEMDIH